MSEGGFVGASRGEERGVGAGGGRCEAEGRGIGCGGFGVGYGHCRVGIVACRAEAEGSFIGVGLPVLEAHVLVAEAKVDGADRTASVLGEYELGFAAYVVAVLVGGAVGVVFGSVYETYNVGVLLYGP